MATCIQGTEFIRVSTGWTECSGAVELCTVIKLLGVSARELCAPCEPQPYTIEQQDCVLSASYLSPILVTTVLLLCKLAGSRRAFEVTVTWHLLWTLLMGSSRGSMLLVLFTMWCYLMRAIEDITTVWTFPRPKTTALLSVWIGFRSAPNVYRSEFSELWFISSFCVYLFVLLIPASLEHRLQKTVSKFESSLVAYTPEAGEEWVCTICRDDTVEDCVALPCKHTFHRDCVVKWVHTSKRTECVYCRQ
jgi:hypothetical protein